jgi:ABC-type phosphate transport system substrate-binding protein
MKLKTTLVAGLIVSTLFTQSSWAQSAPDHISVVGSSTVYPFSTVVTSDLARRQNSRCQRLNRRDLAAV